MLRREKGHQNGKISFRLGLREKLLVGIVLPLVLILSASAFVTQSQIVNIVSEVKNDNITHQVRAATQQIDTYFDKFFLAQDILKSQECIQQLFVEMEASGSENFRFENAKNFPIVLKSLQNVQNAEGSAVKAIWVAGVKNSQVMQADGVIFDASFEITDAYWYKMLQDSAGKSIITPAYDDTVTGEQIVTLATPCYDANNRLIGVVGTDILTSEISAYLDTITIGKTGYVTVYDATDRIIYHPNDELLGVSMTDVRYSENMRTALENHHDSDIMKYRRDNLVFYGNSNYIENLGWNVIGSMSQGEYMQEIYFAVATTVVGILLCIVLFVIISIHRAKAIVKPLHVLNEAAFEFAKGNLDTQIVRTTNDEVGDLTDVFIQTQHGLKEIISDIGYVIHELSNKNLTVTPSITYQGAFVEIENSLHGIAQRMHTVISTIRNTANQVNSSASQLSSGAQLLADGATQQASSVEELASTISEVSEKMQSLAQDAQDASARAENIGTEVENSSSKMQLMMQAMERIDDSANEIQKIILAIEDIAFQTNILALNAAVEAARAGTAGKGFAVVADEVRNLAGKSAEASKTTATLISNSLAAVKDGMLLAREATEALSTAVNDVQAVAGNVQGVSQNLHKQVDAMQQLTIGIDQISDVVQTNSATAQESAAASEELYAQANNLNSIMNEFKLK